MAAGMDSGPAEAGGGQARAGRRRRRDKAGWVEGFISRRSFWVPAAVMCETPCSWGGQEDPPPPLIPVREGMKVPGRAGNLRAGWVMPSMGSLTWHPFLTVAPTAWAVTAKVGPPVPQHGQEGGLGLVPPSPSACQPWAATRRTRPLQKGPCRAPTAPCLPSTAAFSRLGGSGLGGGAQRDPSGARGYHEASGGFTPL